MRNSNTFRAVILLVLVITSLILSGSAVYLTGDWAGLLMSIGTNLLSTALTYYLIDRLIGVRERREGEELEKSKLKQKLITKMSSNSNSVALTAVEELRQLGWLYDGTLQDIDFLNANLQGANLSKADLKNVNLSDANLQEANLTLANLQGAQLHGADLQRALLVEANLREASLVSCNLHYANLRNANLQESELLLANLSCAKLLSANLDGANLGGASLSGADLSGASLQQAKVEDVLADEATILPDGTRWSQASSVSVPLAINNRSIKQ